MAFNAQPQRPRSLGSWIETAFSEQLTKFCAQWKRSTETSFICGLPGKEYEVWTNVSLRMTVLDAVREGRLSLSQPADSVSLALARNIYRNLPTMLGRALAAAEFDQLDIHRTAERSEAEFRAAGIDGSHTIALSSKILFDGPALIDCVLGAAATDANAMFLSDIHRVDFEQRCKAWSIQTPVGFSAISDSKIVQSCDLFNIARRHY